MLNRFKLRDIVEKIFQINVFNLNEYQDKYYFQKKVLEEVPEFSHKEVYSAVENLLSKSNNFNSKDFTNKLSDELYTIYLARENATTTR